MATDSRFDNQKQLWERGHHPSPFSIGRVLERVSRLPASCCGRCFDDMSLGNVPVRLRDDLQSEYALGELLIMVLYVVVG